MDARHKLAETAADEPLSLLIMTLLGAVLLVTAAISSALLSI